MTTSRSQSMISVNSRLDWDFPSRMLVNKRYSKTFVGFQGFAYVSKVSSSRCFTLHEVPRERHFVMWHRRSRAEQHDYLY